jgi:hypothetical protein
MDTPCRSPNHSRRQRGVAAVEFALVLVVLLLIASGAVELGRTLWHFNALSKATRDAARQLSVTAVEAVASQGVPTARLLVVRAAAAAGVVGIADGQVEVQCLNSSFASEGCQDGVAPAYVRVRIASGSLVLGAWMGLYGADGAPRSYSLGVGPQTTMRYLPL